MTIKGTVAAGAKNAVIQFDDGFLGHNFFVKNCILDGENTADRLAISGNGMLDGTLEISSTKFQNFAAAVIINNAPALEFNKRKLTLLTFTSNTVTGSKGAIIFKGAKDTPIDTVTFTGNTIGSWASQT